MPISDGRFGMGTAVATMPAVGNADAMESAVTSRLQPAMADGSNVDSGCVTAENPKTTATTDGFGLACLLTS